MTQNSFVLNRWCLCLLKFVCTEIVDESAVRTNRSIIGVISFRYDCIIPPFGIIYLCPSLGELFGGISHFHL